MPVRPQVRLKLGLWWEIPYLVGLGVKFKRADHGPAVLRALWVSRFNSNSINLSLNSRYIKAKPGTPVSLSNVIAFSNFVPLFGSTFVNLHTSTLTYDKGKFSSRGFCEVIAEDKIAPLPEHPINILVPASSINHQGYGTDKLLKVVKS